MINKLVKPMDEEIDEKKSEGYTGVISQKVGTNEYYALQQLSDERKDFQEVNKGQFKIIYDQKDLSIKFFENEKPKRKPNFKIRFDTPFYMNIDNFFDKSDKSIETFLTKADKVGLSKSMALIPFISSNKCYYLTIDNDSEIISLNHIKMPFTYLNSQSNLYDQIRRNISKTLRESYLDEFITKLLFYLKTASKRNNILFNEIFNDTQVLCSCSYIFNSIDGL